MADWLQDTMNARRQAACLLEDVLDERLEPRLTLNRWPEPSRPDPSLDAAYQALWHFEADEELQHSEVFYLDAQLSLLQQMAVRLAKGESLPQYLLEPYTGKQGEHCVRYHYPRGLKAALCHACHSMFGLMTELWCLCRKASGHSKTPSTGGEGGFVEYR